MRLCKILCLSLLGGGLACLSALSAPKDKIMPKAGREITLSAEGLSFRSLKDCLLQPVTVPDSSRMIRGQEKFDVYHWPDLWKQEQTVGCLSTTGITIRIGRLFLPVPTNGELRCVMDDFLTKARFDEWRNFCVNAGKTPADTAAWIEKFTGIAVEPGVSGDAKGAGPLSIVPCPPKGLDHSNSMLYLVSDRRFPGRTYLFHYEFDSIDNAKRVERVVLNSVGSVRIFKGRETAVERKQLRGVSAKPVNADKFQQSRERVIRNINDVPGWWFLETSNYILASDLKKRSDIARIQEESEKVRRAYAKLLPAPDRIDEVSVIRIFAERGDYAAYVGDDLKWTAGVWMAAKRELVVSMSDWRSGRDKTDELIRVLYHELFHQYVFYAADSVQAHVWFNEGMAQFFENLDIRANGNLVHSLPKNAYDKGHAAATGRCGDIRLLKDMSNEEFQKNPQLNYPAVWSVMYFMLKGAPEMKGTAAKYALIPARYYHALLATRSAEQANAAAWKDVDMDEFNRAYRDFWERKNLFNKSRNNNKLIPFQAK